jgi:dihydrolipoamide dehydrogenase
MLPRLLPGEDEDVSRQLERSFQAQGINLRTGSAVEDVTVEPDHVRVTIERGAETETLQAERVLVGVGFAAVGDDLGLAEAGVELQRGWVKIDDYGQTNVPSIWAAGDATGRLLLAHVASQQGVTAVEKIAGLNPPPLDYDRMPRAVYCQPQVASLGLTEAQARERGFDALTGRFPFRASGKALASGDDEGFVKVVIDKASGAILGYHMIGHNVTELLGEASIASLLESTVRELGYAVHAHPTLSEALKEAALAVSGESLHFYTRRRE